MGGSTAKATGEFSRIVTLDRLGEHKIAERIEATVEERALVSARLGLLGLDSLSADCRLSPGLGGLIVVDGRWAAELTQACVVTLEPVHQSLSGDFQVSYQTLVAGTKVESEVLVDPEADDPPEPLPGEGIDLGELVVQELAVSLDPYPRVDGAVLPDRYRPSEDEGETSPFAALKVLKSKR